MLIKLHKDLETDALPLIKKTVDGQDVSDIGAFSLDTDLVFSVRVPRVLGATAVTLRLWRDGEEYADYSVTYDNSRNGCDSYKVSLCFSRELCNGEDGLFYYKFLFHRNDDILYTNTYNNVDFFTGDDTGRSFRLLIYRKDYHVPTWFAGGVMYQIFVDRFFKGQGAVGHRTDAVINPNWESGIPQFAPCPGAHLENNEFFGGNLWGVAEKLDRLKTMGVTTLYLNPIFKAYSNHKYDTGDYMQIDEMFGGEAAFTHLLSELKKRNMRIILDGVFNHTGDNSRYFNRYGKYETLGAYQSKDSEYYDWYGFRKFPDNYDSWWGINILPKLNPNSVACREFLAGEDGVADTYVKKGIDGWRLDVADELSDALLDKLRTTVKTSSNDDAIIIGEVWENAADKIAYGKRRRYLRGTQLDSVMSYPTRNAILSLVLHQDSKTFSDILKELYSSYPPMVCHSLMNLIGTHDTDRILTTLSGALPQGLSNAELSVFRLLPEEKKRAVARLKLASTLQFTVFGVPSVYYGDEAGLEGGHDPFCRMPYPWGREHRGLLDHYKRLGKMRATHSAFKDGTFRILNEEKGFVCFERENNKERILILANAGVKAVKYTLDGRFDDVFTGRKIENEIKLLPLGYAVLKCEK